MVIDSAPNSSSPDSVYVLPEELEALQVGLGQIEEETSSGFRRPPFWLLNGSVLIDAVRETTVPTGIDKQDNNEIMLPPEADDNCTMWELFQLANAARRARDEKIIHGARSILQSDALVDWKHNFDFKVPGLKESVL